MSTDKKPSREAPERSPPQVKDDEPRSERSENAIKYRENVDRVNRLRDTEIERAVSGWRR